MSVGYQNGGNNSQVKSQQGQGAQEQAPDWDALKDDVGEIAGAAMARGRHFLDSARDQATSYVDRRKDDVAQSVTDFASSLRESTTSFDDRPNIAPSWTARPRGSTSSPAPFASAASPRSSTRSRTWFAVAPPWSAP
jgi:hypothetical protein